jgi:DNA-binding SARP family transcriptional activator/tetratricopeptide (TPR) repeat protein
MYNIDMLPLSLSLLGPMQICWGDEPIQPALWAKSRALLSYVAVEAGAPHRREALAGLLWPDCSEAAARTSLRQALYQLRSALEPGSRVLVVTAQTVQWNADGARVDLHEFLGLVERCRLHPHASQQDCPECIDRLKRAASLYKKDLLADFGLKDCIAFEEWLMIKREQVRQMALAALDGLAEHYDAAGAYELMEQASRRQVEIDPYRESARRQVMRALAGMDRRSQALEYYRDLARFLDSELGVRPDQATVALFEEISRGQPAPERSAGAASYSQPAAWTTPAVDAYPRPAFSGRKRELGWLSGFFHKVTGGQGQVVFVAGEAGWGKTALLDEFVYRAQGSSPDAIVAGGTGVAYTGMGDPYLPFREILRQLTGDVAERVAAGGMSPVQAERLWRLVPAACQALVESGPGLVGTFISGEDLLRRAESSCAGQAGAECGWLVSLRKLVERLGARAELPAGDALSQAELFAQYARVILRLADERPFVLILDNLQWADEGSVGLFHHLGQQVGAARILLVGAYRPSEVLFFPPQNGDPRSEPVRLHPLEPVLVEFKRRWGEIEICVDQGDDPDFIQEYLDSEPNRLGHDFREMLYRQTRACPLFTVELLRGMQERGDLVRDDGGRWVEGAVLDWERLPARVEAVIAERFRQLPVRLVDILKIASVEGEVFTAEVIARVQQAEDFDIIRALGGELARFYHLIRSYGTGKLGEQLLSQYQFSHILFQRYLYQNLDPAEHIYLHLRVAAALEKLYAGAEENVVVQLAWHFQEAMSPDKAIGYLLKAGQRAGSLSAHIEAIAYYQRALDLIGRLPDASQRATLELPLQMSLGVSILSIQGYGAEPVVTAFSRALALCRQIGDTPETFAIQWQLACFYATQTELKRAGEMMANLVRQGERQENELLIVIGYWGLGWHQFFLAEFSRSLENLRKMIDLYDPAQHHRLAYLYGQDPGIACRAVASIVLLIQGYPEQAIRMGEEAIDLARTLVDPYGLALALGWAVLVAGTSHDFARLRRVSAEEYQHSSQFGYNYWVAVGQIGLGWGEVEGGKVKEGLEDLLRGLQNHETSSSKILRGHARMLKAIASSRLGEMDEAIRILQDTLAEAQASGEQHHSAELYRCLGDLLWQKGEPAEVVEDAYWQAITLAHQQGARFWQLRATTSLYRFYAALGDEEKSAETRRMLAELYAWFSEGFDLPDLVEVRALLAD